MVALTDKLLIKISEHKKEIDESMRVLDTLKLTVKSGTRPDSDLLMKMGIIKDKIMFHKACAACLEDLRDELDDEV